MIYLIMIYTTINQGFKWKILVFLVILTLLIGLVNASEENEILEGEKLIKSKISCDKLNDEQLEGIGEYIMESMHPGELHEAMDERMGGEGSENLRLVHVNMAKMMYCGENDAMPANMMNMMMNRGAGGFGMMGNFESGYGMMGNYFGGLFYGWRMMIFWILVIIIVIWLIIWGLKNSNNFSIGSGNSLDIIKRRYAKGEITKKQFEEMKKELR